MPQDRGGILVSWHVSGVIDPALMVNTFPREVAFGARLGLLKIPVIGKIMDDSAAAKAGMQPGDRFLALNDIALDSWVDLVNTVRELPGQTVTARLQRGDLTVETLVTPDEAEENGVRFGRIGRGGTG